MFLLYFLKIGATRIHIYADGYKPTGRGKLQKVLEQVRWDEIQSKSRRGLALDRGRMLLPQQQMEGRVCEYRCS